MKISHRTHSEVYADVVVAAAAAMRQSRASR